MIAAVLHAARAGRHELVFVPTDATAGAGPLYERLGFEPRRRPALARKGGHERARSAIAWRHGYHAAVCNRVEPWAHGTVARADDVPTYYEYNLARVEGRDPGLEAEALAAAAEPALADLGHRRIEVEDTPRPRAAGAGLRGARLGRRAARVPAPRVPGPRAGGRTARS